MKMQLEMKMESRVLLFVLFVRFICNYYEVESREGKGRELDERASERGRLEETSTKFNSSHQSKRWVKLIISAGMNKLIISKQRII